jgi:Flp pilus assembly protein TadG
MRAISKKPMKQGPQPKRRTLGLQSGQALVELAIMLPVLLLLALGVIELGRYAYIGILVGNAARAGAAYGAQSHAQATCAAPFPCGIQTAANNDFQSNGQPVSKLTVDATFSCGCDSGGTINPPPSGTNAYCFVVGATSCAGGGHFVEVVSVTAHGTFDGLFNYPGIPSSITISRLAQMRVAD